MGVGAVFISTLAVHRLPEPAEPPHTQADYLALTLQPIVSFLVLASIIIRESSPSYKYKLLIPPVADGLSVPFLSVRRNVSRAVSLSKSITNPSRSSPEWLLGVNRNPTFPQQPTSAIATVNPMRSPTPPLMSEKQMQSEIIQDLEMGKVDSLVGQSVGLDQERSKGVSSGPKPPKAVHFPSP